MSLVFLTGMPGAGKSFWGRNWAAQHHWAFSDLDDDVEALAGVSVSQIFASAGEEGFRAIESHVLGQTIKGAGAVNTIIATGGGTPAFGDNLDLMLQAGCVVYLKARSRTILNHLELSAGERPLLQSLSDEAIEALLESRRPFYERAHEVVEVERIGAGTFAQILQACTDRHS